MASIFYIVNTNTSQGRDCSEPFNKNKQGLLMFFFLNKGVQTFLFLLLHDIQLMLATARIKASKTCNLKNFNLIKCLQSSRGGILAA